MKKRKRIQVLLIIWLVLIAIAGGLMIAKPYIIDTQRKTIEHALVTMIESGQREIDLPDIPEMEGEQFSGFEELEEVSPEPEEIEKKVITGYGLIEIPVIELEMPLVEGADTYSLRVAAGWWPRSAPMGSVGNCVIFGHRMVTYGRHFNRLDEVKPGDEVILYNMEGERFVYTVTGKEVIEPGVLEDTLYAHSEGFSLTLVTCTPTGVGSHRLLVYAELKDSAEE